MKSLLLVGILAVLPQLANASQVLKCVIGNQNIPDGTATIEVLDVVQDSNLKVFKIDLITRLVHSAESKTVHLQGAITASISESGGVLAHGGLQNVLDPQNQHALINPPDITLQSLSDKGIHAMSLLDSNRQLQLGFGVLISCK